MSLNPIFTPVQSTEERIKELDRQHGRLYFATDTGRMFLDTESDRINVGGSGGGISIYYGDSETPEKNEETELYIIPTEDVKDYTLKEGGLILNSDGGFYKVLNVSEEAYTCTLLSISGTGTGPAVSMKKPTISFHIDRTNLINGQKAYFTVSGQTAFEEDKVTPVDVSLKVTYSLGTRITSTVVNNYYTTTQTYPLDAEGKFTADIEFGSRLKESSSTVLTVYISGDNHDLQSSVRTIEVQTSALKLNQLSSYTPANIYSTNGLVLSCNVVGSIDKIVKFYYDNKLMDTRSLGYQQANETVNFTVPAGAYDEDD